MVFTTLAILAPLAYTTAVNALPLDSKTSRHVRRQSGGPNWSAVGCYTDNVAARTFKGAELVSDSMTTSNCQDFCYSKGYKYAGTEWSRECFCDDDFQNGGVLATSGCDMKCTGAEGETCGGEGRLTVYENTGNRAPVGLAGVSILQTYDIWSLQGCFVDSVAARIVPTQVAVDAPFTPQRCMDKCASLGFTYAGMEYFHECFCSSTVDVGSLATASEASCYGVCDGDANHYCGAGNALLLYHTTGAVANPGHETIGDWTGQGCYTDSVADRALPHQVQVDGSMTIEKCTSKCFSGDFAYAGLEFGTECFCAAGIGSSGVQATDGCTMPCSGNPNQLRGGGNRLNVYHYTSNNLPTGPTVLASYKAWGSNGCYVDSVANRLMTHLVTDNAMTAQTCIDGCMAAGYHVAGVEFGTECYCTATLPADSFKATNNCNMACAGDSAQLCGGPDRLNVYSPTTLVTSPATLPAKWSYTGCVSSAVASANVDVQAAQPQPWTMPAGQESIETCLAHCDSESKHYAGIIGGNTCYCMTEPATGMSYRDAGCTTVCPAAFPEACGGIDSFSVYTKAPTPSNNAVAQWAYQGCLEPNYGQGVPAVSQQLPAALSTTATNIETCLNYCTQNNQQLAALSGDHCFCLAQSVASLQYTATCSSACSGKPGDLCGTTGDVAFSVYFRDYPVTPTNNAIAPWTYQGCLEPNYAQSVSEVAQQMQAAIATTATTIESCLDYCTQSNQGFTGLSGDHCFCIAQSVANLQYTATCSSACSGKAGDLCGTTGDVAFSVYFRDYPIVPEHHDIPPWKHRGCLDPTYAQTVPEIQSQISTRHSTTTDDLTISSCLAFCDNYRYQFAALSGNNCECLSYGPDDLTFAATCTTPCPGDAHDLCGSTGSTPAWSVYFRSSVYK